MARNTSLSCAWFLYLVHALVLSLTCMVILLLYLVGSPFILSSSFVFSEGSLILCLYLKNYTKELHMLIGRGGSCKYIDIGDSFLWRSVLITQQVNMLPTEGANSFVSSMGGTIPNHPWLRRHFVHVVCTLFYFSILYFVKVLPSFYVNSHMLALCLRISSKFYWRKC